MIKEFAEWLVTRVPGLTVGGNLQVPFRAQDAPVRCHTLLDSGGPADPDLPYREDALYQIATRGETAMEARDDARAIYKAICGKPGSGWTIGPLVSGGQRYKIWSIRALAKPQYLGIGEDGGFEYSCNYLVTASQI
jgi:hypothetical protein